MTDIKTTDGLLITVDRDYAGAIGEDVELRITDGFLVLDPFFLHPDEAFDLAAALKQHAKEVRTINKENQ